MKPTILLPLAALSLASCATVLTPQRCAGVDTAAATVEQIAAVLVNAGIEQAKAQKLAQAVATGQMLLAVACAQANPVQP